LPRFALVLGVLSLACSLSVVAFFVGVPLGLVSLLLALAALRAFPSGTRLRRHALRALVTGGLGFAAGLAVWFVHVRAVQTAYSIPPRQQLLSEFEEGLAHATAPLPNAPPRLPLIPPLPAPTPAKDAR